MINLFWALKHLFIKCQSKKDCQRYNTRPESYIAFVIVFKEMSGREPVTLSERSSREQKYNDGSHFPPSDSLKQVLSSYFFPFAFPSAWSLPLSPLLPYEVLLPSANRNRLFEKYCHRKALVASDGRI